MSIDGQWGSLLEHVARLDGGVVYVVGESDTGKTTLSQWLISQTDGRPRWFLDCDPGQSVLGPPATVGIAEAAGDAFTPPLLSFVGATSPKRHLLQTTAGIGRLLREVPASELVVCDSSGFVSGRTGSEFQYSLMNLLRPAIIVAIEPGEVLENALRPFAADNEVAVLPMSRAPGCRRKSRAARASYRRRRFTTHFEGAVEHRFHTDTVSLHGMVPHTPDAAAYRSRLCALLDRRRLVRALGIVVCVGVGRSGVRDLSVLSAAPAPDEITAVQLGSLRLAPEDLTYREPPAQTTPPETARGETDGR